MLRSNPTDDPLWRMRWLSVASVVMVLVALAAMKIFVVASWSWTLFTWGFVVSLVGATVMGYILRWALARPGITDERRTRLRHRLILTTGEWVGFGFILGSSSAMLGVPWLNIAIAIYVALLAVFGMLARSRIRRSVQTNPDGSDPAQHP